MESLNNSEKIDRIVELCHTRLSKYRQGKQDLIARMATDWPEWTSGLDFHGSFIHPLLRNALVLNFINDSDGINLSNFIIRFYYGKRNNINKIDFEEVCYQVLDKSGNEIISNINLLDFPKYSVEEENKENKIEPNPSKAFIVSVRDADIGVQAFFSLFEGIVRNSAKHGIQSNNGEFEVHIVFWENFADFFQLIGSTPPNINLSSGFSLSVSYDLTNDVPNHRRCVKSGKEKIDLVTYLQDKMNEEIIDKTSGILNPGNWGLKEIKSCAAFISGKNIQDVNSQHSEDYLMISQTTENWDDNKERIIYGVPLDRVRHILVVVEERKIPTDEILNKWINFGIRIVSKDDLFENTNYSFIVIDEGFNPSDLNNQRTPQRLLKYHFSDENFFSSFDPNKASTFILTIYDNWLKQIVNNKEGHLIIYFDDTAKAHAWESRTPTSLKYQQFNVAFPYDENNFFTSLNNLQDNPLNFVFSRHKTWDDVNSYFNEGQDEADIINLNSLLNYFQEVSYNDLFLSFLMSIDTNSLLSEIVLRQIFEACYLKVLIIDERIAQILNTDIRGISRVSELRRMGIDVAKSVKVKQHCFSYLSSADNENDFIDFYLDDNITNYNMIFIHATRLNELFDIYTDNFSDKSEFVTYLKKSAKGGNENKFVSIIVHSGRGKTEGDIPSNAPFLEYSILQKYIIQEPSKFYLVQIGLSIL